MLGGLVLRVRARSFRAIGRSTTDWRARFAGNWLCHRRQVLAEAGSGAWAVEAVISRQEGRDALVDIRVCPARFLALATNGRARTPSVRRSTTAAPTYRSPTSG